MLNTALVASVVCLNWSEFLADSGATYSAASRQNREKLSSLRELSRRWSERASTEDYLIYSIIVLEEENKEECLLFEIMFCIWNICTVYWNAFSVRCLWYIGNVSAFYYLGKSQTICSPPPTFVTSWRGLLCVLQMLGASWATAG